MVEAQLATTNDKLLEMEQSKAVTESVNSERLSEITELQRRLEGSEVREGLVGELNGQIASLERQVVKLQGEVRISLSLSLSLFLSLPPPSFKRR